MIGDYMVTYDNFYGVKPGTTAYDALAESNIRLTLRTAFGVETLEGADLKACAEAYLAGIGLTEEEISTLREKLTR